MQRPASVRSRAFSLPAAALPLALLLLPVSSGAAACERTIIANVVAIDQPLMFNRLGAQNINGMMFALRRDVVLRTTVGDVPANTPLTAPSAAGLSGIQLRGNVQLRPDKRPRPIVLRVAEGDCLTVNFQNLLSFPDPNPFDAAHPNLQIDEQVADRAASFHAQGMQLRAETTLAGGIENDGSHVGLNPTSLAVEPGESRTYRLYAEKSGAFLVQSYGATFGSEGQQGNSANGLFGAINVEPRGARFYRSQLTEEEMRLAADANNNGILDDAEKTSAGQPIINYEKLYPGDTGPWSAEGKAGLPVINMLTADNELVHSDINAIIVGPNDDGTFPTSTYPLERVGRRNPALPNRLEPFREFTIVFHDETAAAQVFPLWYNDPVFGYVLEGVKDGFMINYGSGGVGSEIIANRLRVGPMHDCLTCAYEEFFLTSYTVGDPGMVVDIPANFGLENCSPGLTNCSAVGPKATEAFYSDDPGGVHHAYINDRLVYRNVHSGKEQHVFHLHNHQWLFNPNDDNSNYLDAQGIGPGSGYTYEINFGGSGNRNKSAGDAIFHCHFYPHFAQGMWELQRNHDVFESGTLLDVTVKAPGGKYHNTAFGLISGRPAPVVTSNGTLTDWVAADLPAAVLPDARARALPDGEIVDGTPIPALVPLPGKPMPVMPGKVNVVPKKSNGVTVGSNAWVDRTVYPTSAEDLVPAQLHDKIKNPGYPFWIASIEDVVGQRPATPPLDMDESLDGFDGGLPRHAVDGIAAATAAAPDADIFTPTITHLDLTKVVHRAKAVFYPEAGTDVEQAVMDFHGKVRLHPTFALSLTGAVPAAGFFTTNGYRDTSTPGNPATDPGPQPGSPYHEPCIDDQGMRLTGGSPGSFFNGSGGFSSFGSSPLHALNPRVYKGANLQFDAILNKAGYHYPQQRIIALWEDVVPTISKTKPPEPLVMRLNTFDCAMYQHSNLVPENFEMDDYQIRTPTDIIGQHIHLPKWDLTTTDGSANGWNYEDGTLSPGAVRERIHAITTLGLTQSTVGKGSVEGVPGFTKPGSLAAEPHPFFGQFPRGECPDGDWCGARTTLQRWFADPVVNVQGQDRGLGIIFTHDHYGPSTHQQIGLYATLLTEPAGSEWRHNETGVLLGTRDDGGPTSWQAAIRPPSGESFREFYLEYSDFQHAYEAGVFVGAGPDGRPLLPPNQPLVLAGAPEGGPADLSETFRFAINPPARAQINPVFPDLYEEVAGGRLPGCPTRPCPQAISVQDPGMYAVNYRNEPIALRVFNPNRIGPDGVRGAQTLGPAGDLGLALQSRNDRAIPALRTQPNFFGGAFLNARQAVAGGDPFTPMMRAYAGDLIRVKIQSGGHEEEHNITIHGVKWLQSGSGFGRSLNSGWRNSQAAGISEQFTFTAPLVPLVGRAGATADYAYATNASEDGWWSGAWGIARVYNNRRADLFQLPNTTVPVVINNPNDFNGACPRTAPLKRFDISAVLANDVLPKPAGVTISTPIEPVTGLALTSTHAGGPLNPDGGTLVYNPRPGPESKGPLHDPTAILYVRTEDLVTTPGAPNFGKLRDGAPVEPLVIRANAGDCIEVTLRNKLPGDVNGNTFFDDNPDLPGFQTNMGVVKRQRRRGGNPPDPALGSTTFQNNLIRPSSLVGLHAQLVTYDVTRDDGVVVGNNAQGEEVIPPGTATKLYRWYVGDIGFTRLAGGRVNLVATPVEFGGAGLFPADKIKQGQKSMVGAMSFARQDATTATTDTVPNLQGDSATNPTRETQTMATVTPPSATPFRDFVAVFQKKLAMRYADSTPVEHINGEGVGIPEDSQDNTHMAINYRTEPMWFRFGLTPNAPFGNTPGGFGAVEDAHLAYSNSLVDPVTPANGDPVTPIFTATPGQPFRLHAVLPHSTDRGSTLNLHGHVWQRQPYVCPPVAGQLLPGLCTATQPGSQLIGSNPLSMYLGGQESLQPYGHFDFVFPSAGGVDAVPGDYLFRDQAGMGNVSGLWGILRVVGP